MPSYRLPWPPSVNTYLPVSRSGHKYMTERGKEFRAAVCEIVGTVLPMRGRLRMSIELSPPTRRKFDVDNYAKAICDSLELANVYDDDSQIDELRIVRLPVVRGGAADVVIEPV